jgi:hypothetical protein
MKSRCPFCLDPNVRNVRSGRAGRGTSQARLRQCPDCESWYWADSEQPVDWLFSICETPHCAPGECLEEILVFTHSHERALPRPRRAEFNTLCSLCPKARFAAVRNPAPASRVALLGQSLESILRT